ncbi:MAG TPA: c-type cytochrome domain-containing protein [Terriglobales bacterium]
MIAAKRVEIAVRSLWAQPRARQWFLVLGAAIVLFVLPFLIHLDGRPHAEWLEFFGRFHPLLVHLPIGFLVLLPLLELAGSTRPALREAAGFVLQIAVAACVITLAFGILLAYGSGVSGTTVTRHMWAGIVLLVELLVCLIVRPPWAAGQVRRVYPVVLAVTLLTLTFTAHLGGSLTHGSDYLTRYMPGPMKRIVGSSSLGSDAAYVGSVYMRSIHPILDAKCVACHGSSKEQSGLRLDLYELLMKGGKDGIVVKPKNPDGSLLVQRVTLSPGDKHFMPAEGRTPLTPDEISTLRAWILAGASPSATTVQGITLAAANADVPFEPVGDYSGLMKDIRQMQQSSGAKLVAVSARASDGLILRTVDVAATFDDAQLARFQRFAPFIVEAELGRTAVTDASMDTISKFTQLRILHLEDTAITGKTLAKLSSLSHLTYLNLSGTKVTSSALEPIKKMPNLRHIYFFDTSADSGQSATTADVTR